MKILTTSADTQVEEMDKGFNVSRRRFLQLTGGIAGAGLLLNACKPVAAPAVHSMGTGDTGLLNFLYILQQIEAAFYTQAVATPYYGMDNLELMAITDVRDQEIAHMEYFKKLLAGDAVDPLSPDFSTVVFADRASVLSSAAKIEDIVISGLNGASTLFGNKGYSLAFSKMASVEARHSAYFRQMNAANTFADTVIDANGLDQALSPALVLTGALVYSHTKYDANGLPNH